jgi:hypothetical protein
MIGTYLLISTCPNRTGIGSFAGRGQGIVDALVPYARWGIPDPVLFSTLTKNYEEDRRFGKAKADG